jgi:alcohol dehydrogenase
MTPTENTSLAAVFHGAGKPLTLERFAIPPLSAGETLVRIRCATICGSDLHSRFGRRATPAPCVLGHEMAGEISAMGSDGVCDYRGARLSTGDRVTWSMVWSCGECFYCNHGLRQKCELLMKFGHETIAPGRALTGAMAESCVLPAGTSIFRIPDSLPDEVACQASCATATVAAVFRHAGPVHGEVVVVIGAGMLGLTACAMAAEAGAARVIAIEPDARRRDLSLCFGADLAIDGTRAPEEVLASVRELSACRGADICVEFAGSPEAVELGVRLLRIGGRFIMAGAVLPGHPVQLSGEDLVRRMIRMSGLHNYSPEDLETALRFLESAADSHPFAELVAARFPLRDVNEAFAYAETERPLRVALIP